MPITLKDCPYADDITRAMKVYLPEWAPEWGHAQLYQESLWKPDAKSEAGAMGIAQFMPDTWHDMIDQLGFVDTASPYDPNFAIPAFAAYMKQMRGKWIAAPRPEADRRRLAQASYNAGFGNVLRAQKVANGANDSGSILAALPQVTGAANAKQTQDYVLRINQYFLELTAPQT